MNSTITNQPASIGPMVQQTTNINKTKTAGNSICNTVMGGAIGLVCGAIGISYGASVSSALILGTATGACVGCCTTSHSKITTNIHNRTIHDREGTPPTDTITELRTDGVHQTDITTQPASLELKVMQTTVINKTTSASNSICNIIIGGTIGLACGAIGTVYGASLNSGLMLGMVTGGCVGYCNTNHSKITTSLHSRIVNCTESTPQTNV